MSYTLNVESDIVRNAEAYALRNGTTVDALVRACLLVLASYGVAKVDPVGGRSQASHLNSLKIGSMRDEVRLPEDFDQNFDALDGEVASLMEGTLA